MCLIVVSASIAHAQAALTSDDPFTEGSIDVQESSSESGEAASRNPFDTLPAHESPAPAANIELSNVDQPLDVTTNDTSVFVGSSQDKVVRARFERALQTQAKFEFREAPLSEVTQFIQDSFSIPVVIDRRALDDVGMGTDTPVTFTVRNVSLQSALDYFLDELDLTYIVRNSVLWITTPEEAEDTALLRFYPVADLVTRAKGSELFGTEDTASLNALVDAITTSIAPNSWSAVGGRGSVADEVEWGLLAVAQTQQVHRQIEELLIAIRTMITPAEDLGAFESNATRKKTFTIAEGAVEHQAREKIELALGQPTTLEFVDAPLSEVVAYLQKLCGSPVLVHRQALDDVGLGIDTPVTVSIQGVSLESALEIVLRPLELTYVIDHESVLITTPEEAEQHHELRVFAVHDLRLPARNPSSVATLSTPATGQQCLDSLIRWITSSIAPDTWDGVGGAGSVVTIDRLGVMIVSQTYQIQEQIGDFLHGIRTARTETIAAPERLDTASDAWDMNASTMFVRVYHIHPDRAHMDQIIQTITSTVAPSQWRADAAIKAIGRTLVVRQTETVHRQVHELLEQLGILWLCRNPGFVSGNPGVSAVRDGDRHTARYSTRRQ